MKTKNIINNLLRITISIIISIFLYNCQNEDFNIEEKNNLELKNNEISFIDFKNETNLKKFKPILKANISNRGLFNKNSIVNESTFLTDTTGIKKYVNPNNNKTTYSFKIYPLNDIVNENEYYNLVYEKNGDVWNELIFLNKEKINPETNTLKLDSSDLIYSSDQLSLQSRTIIIETINHHCTGCTGQCDLCELCVSTSKIYVYINDYDGIDTSETIDAGASSSGGGANSSSIYIPNPYTGEQDVNNPIYILASEVSTYTNSLPQNLQAIIASENWFFPTILSYFRDNNGVTSSSQSNVTTALNNYNNIVSGFNPRIPRVKERFEYWAFNSFLYNNMNTQTVLYIKNYLLSNADYNSKVAVADFLYENLNSNKATNQIIQTLIFLDENPNASQYGINVLNIITNNNLTQEQKLEQINAELENVFPLLSDNLPQDTYSTRVTQIANWLETHGQVEFGNYIESLAPEFSNMTTGEVYDIYKLSRNVQLNIQGQIMVAIIYTIAKTFQPFLEFAVIDATLGVAIPILAKIPLAFVSRGAKLEAMIIETTKLGIEDGAFVRLINGSNITKAENLFVALTKDAISITPPNSVGTIVANMGNGNYITYRIVAGAQSPGVIATIQYNFVEILGTNAYKLKFYP